MTPPAARGPRPGRATEDRDPFLARRAARDRARRDADRSRSQGLQVIGLDDRHAWQLVTKVALDSMPAPRRKVIEHLIVHTTKTTKEVATVLGLPTTTARRTLEDLAAHGVVTRRSGGKGKSDTWALSPATRDDYRLGTVPEMSGNPSPRNKQHAYDDISGTVVDKLVNTRPTPPNASRTRTRSLADRTFASSVSSGARSTPSFARSRSSCSRATAGRWLRSATTSSTSNARRTAATAYALERRPLLPLAGALLLRGRARRRRPLSGGASCSLARAGRARTSRGSASSHRDRARGSASSAARRELSSVEAADTLADVVDARDRLRAALAAARTENERAALVRVLHGEPITRSEKALQIALWRLRRRLAA